VVVVAAMVVMAAAMTRRVVVIVAVVVMAVVVVVVAQRFAGRHIGLLLGHVGLPRNAMGVCVRACPCANEKACACGKKVRPPTSPALSPFAPAFTLRG
jgi:hypothetical protein